MQGLHHVICPSVASSHLCIHIEAQRPSGCQNVGLSNTSDITQAFHFECHEASGKIKYYEHATNPPSHKFWVYRKILTLCRDFLGGE